ncbi:MAG: cation:proton antiporter [Elusimicrobia bacterium]|nr:cation:proton antiporter [Elusimicrobiota bacterium]
MVMQLGVMVLAAWASGRLFERMKMPGVLGEIFAGIILGPYLLGSIPLPGFPGGFFPISDGLPVSRELYSITTLAAIILLFIAGIETNIDTFLSFSFVSTMVGISGVIFSFIFGDITGMLFSRTVFGKFYGFLHPVPMFLGIITTATSVGISARILSEKRKMDSPEGITIISAAVIDDVLGIIALAVVIGIIKSGHVMWGQVAAISAKAVGIWLGFTVAGVIFYRHIERFLKKFRDKVTISIMSFSFALLLSGIFEKSGLAMIIGAYVMGLSLSKSDLSFMIRENISVLQRFLVPVFFCTMGMFVNFREMAGWNTLIFGAAYFVVAFASKYLGCGLPAYLLNFSLHGAATVGIGMVPRSEVALIIAGIGLSQGIIPHEIFSVTVTMVFLTTLITPGLLSRMITSEKPILKKEAQSPVEHAKIRYPMPNQQTAEMVLSRVISAFEDEGFYVYRMEIPYTLFQIRKEDTSLTLQYDPSELIFECRRPDEAFVHTLFYEIIADLEYTVRSLQTSIDRDAIGMQILKSAVPGGTRRMHIRNIIRPGTVTSWLKGKSPRDIISELIETIVKAGYLAPEEKENTVSAVFEREKSMSTGMQYGIALPHARSAGIRHLISAVGVSRDGVEFNALDKKPSRIFILTLIPTEGNESYLQYIAEISKFLADKSNRHRILTSAKSSALYRIFASIENPVNGINRRKNSHPSQTE